VKAAICRQHGPLRRRHIYLPSSWPAGDRPKTPDSRHLVHGLYHDAHFVANRFGSISLLIVGSALPRGRCSATEDFVSHLIPWVKTRYQPSPLRDSRAMLGDSAPWLESHGYRQTPLRGGNNLSRRLRRRPLPRGEDFSGGHGYIISPLARLSEG
jgi:hypothetical protein